MKHLMEAFRFTLKLNHYQSYSN